MEEGPEVKGVDVLCIMRENIEARRKLGRPDSGPWARVTWGCRACPNKTTDRRNLEHHTVLFHKQKGPYIFPPSEGSSFKLKLLGVGNCGLDDKNKVPKEDGSRDYNGLNRNLGSSKESSIKDEVSEERGKIIGRIVVILEGNFHFEKSLKRNGNLAAWALEVHEAEEHCKHCGETRKTTRNISIRILGVHEPSICCETCRDRGMDGRHLEWHKEMAHNDDLDKRPSYKDVEVPEGRDEVFGVLEDTVEAVGGHEDTVEVALLLPVTHSPVPSLQPKDPQPDLAQQVYGGPVQSLHPMPDQT